MNETPKGPAPDRTPLAEGGAYTVLARKYRPQTLDGLIGQDAMVRTLGNAFQSGRIAQAYMLTGVRGVGKTTTARIIARALNYKTPEIDRPTLDMSATGEHCAAIMESRHPDVMEIDAASNTGVDNVREIVDAVRYRPAYARYKVYIVDEVHMLSRAAFNALLKTLEEPPEHVKFVFATTEVRKVPVTVLSRCQRFDLKRVDVELLRDHFKDIATREGVAIDDQALTLIARAAEGSVRDGLSLLDQAIAHGQGRIAAQDVRAMLGLAERTRVFDLLESVLKGRAGAALAELAALHRDGAEPAEILADMAEAVHMATRIKAVGAQGADPTLSEAERTRAESLAERLSMPALTRAWQMLLKGLGETKEAPRPLAAAEMVLVRLAYAADLPSPGDLIRRLDETSTPSAAMPGRDKTASAPERTAPAAPKTLAPAPIPAVQGMAVPEPEPPAAAPPPPLPQSFEAVVALLEGAGEAKLRHALEHQVRLVRYEPGHIEFSAMNGVTRGLADELGARLKGLTGTSWRVAACDAPGAAPLAEQRREQASQERERVQEHPAVRTLLVHFPGAAIEEVRPIAAVNGTGHAPTDRLPEPDAPDHDEPSEQTEQE